MLPIMLIIFAGSANCWAQVTDSEITQLIAAFKKDPRGPYQAIRWFCADGRVLPANERCGQPGSIQHALHKDIVQKIGRENHVFLGQILAGTALGDFFDEANQNSRLKQYQIERFLHSIDNGWILRRARFYRGAIQAEDEEAWGIRFLQDIISQNQVIDQQFYLLREASKDIPHHAESGGSEEIRSLSTTIADTLPAFMDIRVKLHGQPEFSDAQRVINFRKDNRNKIKPNIDEKLGKLIAQLELLGKPVNIESIRPFSQRLAAGSAITSGIEQFLRRHSVNDPQYLAARCMDIARLLWVIRKEIKGEKSSAQRLAALDLSVLLERMLFREAAAWAPKTVQEALAKGYILSLAAAGCGFVEIWEWESLAAQIKVPDAGETLTLQDLLDKVVAVRRVTEWGGGMVRANYQPIVDIFSRFEPSSAGFVDDRIRGSILLQAGRTASALGELAAGYTGVSGKLMGLRYQSDIRGLNPGYAIGELVVIEGSPDHVDFSDKKIYVMYRSTPELKPVAGIATVTEGNLVSHVQLLARNLGIPNAVLSEEALKDLSAHKGEMVFYAVSPRGTVIMKPVAEMTAEEKALVESKKRSEERIQVPVNKLELNVTEFLSLGKLRASNSGKICGPKAANLGQLKSLFPKRVVNGFVIPFGVFRQHMNQKIPSGNESYWEVLTTIFQQAAKDRRAGKDPEMVEKSTIEKLAKFRESVRHIEFLPEFGEHLRAAFQREFGCDPGQRAVFIRSDTNMEDLSEFTGAGLNLTIFNVLETEKILQGIRDVWASPFSERSYRWRQKFLLNPENVYPSIVVMPTVNNDNSGVMITSGIISDEADDLTIAFSRGPGGAVDGQAAESHLLKADGSDRLISPSREMKYNFLPETGGVLRKYSHFDHPVLSTEHIRQLRAMGKEIRQRLPGTAGIDSNGPFDVELGFLKNHLWLFQVRPYVENKRARSTVYLRRLDPEFRKNLSINPHQSL